MKKILQILTLSLALVGTSLAATISIANHDFETGGLVGDNDNSSGAIPLGWEGIPGASPGAANYGAFYGYFNPNDVAYPGTTANPGTIGTMAGPNVFYFGTSVSGQGIQQILTTTFEKNLDYALTVSRGTRLPAPDNGQLWNNTLRMQLLTFNGTAYTSLAAQDFAPGTPGAFEDVTLNYAVNAANDGLEGQSLVIRFYEIDNPGNPRDEVDIDNVRLVPEPGSASLMILGLAAVLAKSRRCSRK